MTVRRAAIIVNPAVKIDIARLKDEVRRQETAIGWAESLWLETTSVSCGTDAALEAIRQGVDLVIVAGGDGTIHSVASVLLGGTIPLAVVPTGTGNLLARNLGLPLDHLATCVCIAFLGRDRMIDVGRLTLERPDGSVEQKPFLVMAGLGIDAMMIAATDPELKRIVGWLAYVSAIVRTLPRLCPLAVSYRVDESATQHAETIHTLLIGNCGTLQANLRILPADLTDGQLGILALGPMRLRGRLLLARWLWWQNTPFRRIRQALGPQSRFDESNLFRYLKTRRLSATFDREVIFEIDGEMAGEVVAVTAWADEAALLVRVPPEEQLTDEAGSGRQP